MKKGLVLLVGILLINMVSAAYSCSEGEIIKERKVIDVGQIEAINRVDIALISSSASISADLLVDADKITLNNETSSIEINLRSGDYDVELINITNGVAEIEIEGKDEEVEEGDIEQIHTLDVYILKIEGTYPGEDAEIELFVGTEYFFLHKNEPTGTKKIDGTEYLFELSSSSNNGAMINVEKCENGSLVEGEEEIETNESETVTPPIQNNSVENQSQEPDNKSTTIENIQETILNNDGLPYIIITIVFCITAIVVVFILYKRNKKQYQPVEPQKSEE